VTARSRRRWLAGAAALAGGLAALAGSPYRRAVARVPRVPGAIDVAELVRIVTDQEDHVSAIELAGWLRAGQPRLRVIDIRTAPEFAAYHIPGAEHITLDRLALTPFAADETVVLYSELGVHGAQAWVFLRALGLHRVFFLRDGLHEWLDDVMSPTIAADAPAAARAEFARISELSRSFGGMPRVLGEQTGASDPEPRARRRGC
jgi:rhodanese-related sulfurtransferase